MHCKLPDVCSYVMNYYVTLSLTNRKSSVRLHALYSPLTALRTFTPRRDQLLINIYRYISPKRRHATYVYKMSSPRHRIHSTAELLEMFCKQ
jgi:hypothetical protein